MKSAAWHASPPARTIAAQSVYLLPKRGLLPPMMTTFDFCDVTQSCGQRDVTTVPTQALALMNNQFVHDRSEALARMVKSEVSDPESQVHALWQKVLGREPSAAETDLALRHLTVQKRRFCGTAPRGGGTDGSTSNRRYRYLCAIRWFCIFARARG